MTEFAAYVGIDWSDQKHDVCMVDTTTGKRESCILKHTPEAIAEWAMALQTHYRGQQIALCLEQSRGPLIYALLKYDFLVLYPVSPKTLAKYREAFSPSRSKDDPSDAQYLVELVMQHRQHLRAWTADDEKTRTLRFLVEHRRRLVGDKTRISNRLTSLLKGYFPQILQWFPDVRTSLVCDFLLRWPSLGALRGVRCTTVQKFLREHHSARPELLESRLEAIKTSVPLTRDEAVISSSVLMVQALAEQMKTTLAAIKRFDQQIAELCSRHQDYEVFASLPGAGDVYSSRLLVAFGTDRERWQSADELACFTGVAPVIERSGQSTWIRWRYFCPKFVRQSFHEYAGESLKHSFWARVCYESQRAKGKSHHAAVRALAYKWMRIIYRCWQSRIPYNEVKYLESLRRKGSPLLNFAGQKTA